MLYLDTVKEDRLSGFKKKNASTPLFKQHLFLKANENYTVDRRYPSSPVTFLNKGKGAHGVGERSVYLPNNIFAPLYPYKTYTDKIYVMSVSRIRNAAGIGLFNAIFLLPSQSVILDSNNNYRLVETLCDNNSHEIFGVDGYLRYPYMNQSYLIAEFTKTELEIPCMAFNVPLFNCVVSDCHVLGDYSRYQEIIKGLGKEDLVEKNEIKQEPIKEPVKIKSKIIQYNFSRESLDAMRGMVLS
jgi:hypothetical protein